MTKKKNVYNIREFAQLSGIETTKLRYWDSIGVFQPLLRDKNKYRGYTAAQLMALNFVTTLSTLGVSLDKIAKLRSERSPENLLELLQNLEHDMDMEMRNLRKRYSVIHARRDLITTGLKAKEDSISVEHLDNKDMILWPRNVYKAGDTFLEPLSALISSTHDLRIDLSFPVGGYYDDMESFAKAPNRPDHFLSIDPEGTHTREAGEYLVGYTRGYYGVIGDLPFRMKAFAKKNKLAITGPVYTLYLIEETCTSDCSQYLACCSVAVT